ncbi:MAG: ribulose-phosphate 3-epimerase [bacterium]|nr:ribulose-phosphate 3-epimerase [bacterium]
MIKIAPSILSADFSKLEQEVYRAEEAGADLIHIDVMDGHFVPNITIGPVVVKSIRNKTSIPLDVHLMIENPDKYIDAFAEAGADIITVHVEACEHLHKTFDHIRKFSKTVGVSLNPSTPIVRIEHILKQVDMVLVMTVNPGFSGQKFIRSVLPKIKELKQMIDNAGLPVDIEVDGGIDEVTAADVVKAGANILVAGTAVFKATDIKEAIAKLRGKGNSNA